MTTPKPPIKTPIISKELLESEIALFIEYKNLLAKHNNYLEIDKYGFILSDSKRNSKPEIDVFVFGLTHGNEVIGLQIINLILLEILRSGARYNIGFLLNNIKAYHQNIRFVEFDLNRSFLKTEGETLEFKRAQQIEKIIDSLDIKLILDLHQTVEPAVSPFAIIPETSDLIEKAYKIAPQIPIVTFKTRGFSSKGKTLAEYAFEKKIPALIYELGEKGFNDQTAHEFKETIINLSAQNILNSKSADRIEYFHIETLIPNQDGLELVPGLINYMDLQEGQILAKSKTGTEYRAPYSSKLIFPRYQNIDKNDAELGYIAVQRFIR